MSLTRQQESGYVRMYRLTASDRVLQILSLFTVLGAFQGKFTLFVFTVTFCSVSLFTFHVLQAVLGLIPSTRESLHRVALHFFGYLWLVVPLSHILIPLGWPNGQGLSALLLWTSWLGDGAAYYIGSKFGRHKPFGVVSPNKSTEGFIATVTFSILLCYFFKRLQVSGYSSLDLPDVHTFHYVVFGALIGILGTLGDVSESFIKRVGNVKDSGTFFSGHGGILDRFDAFFLCTPALMYYYYYIVLEHWRDFLD